MTRQRRIPLLLVLLVALSVVAATAAPVRAQQSLRIAAVVNDDVISLYDLQTRMALILHSSNLPNTLEIRKKLAPEALRSLIDEKLKTQEAERLGISVSEDEIATGIAKVERANNLPPGGLAQKLARAGLGIEGLQGQLEAELAWNKVVRSQLRSRVQISEKEVDDILADLEAAKDAPQYHIREILVPFDNPADEAEARNAAQRLLGELRSGASFAAMARNFSKGATAEDGGDLGWVRKSQLPGILGNAVERMAPGQVTQPLKTLAGYHILKLEGTRVGNQVDPGETKVTLSQVFLPLPENADVRQVSGAMDKARRVAAQARSCKDMEGLGPKEAGAMSGSLGTVRLKDLPDDIRGTVANQPVGQASAPQRTPQGVVVLMVCDRQAPPEPKMPSRQDIKLKLLNERILIHARRYLRDLRHSAIVDIRL